MIGITPMIGIAVCGMLLSLLLKGMKSELYIVVALVTCGILLYYSLNLSLSVMEYLRRLAHRFSLEDVYLQTVFKVIGIGYVCTLASQLCKDAGQASIGVQVELFGKLLILVQALPIAAKLIDTLTGIL